MTTLSTTQAVAMDEFYRNNYKRLLNRAMTLTEKDEALSQDIVMDTLEAMAQNEIYGNEWAIKWAYRALKNRYIKVISNHDYSRKQTEATDDDGNEVEVLEWAQTKFPRAFELDGFAGEFSDRTTEALLRCSVDTREILYKDAMGWTVQEIANEWGTPLRTTYRLLKSAQDELRQALVGVGA